MLKNSNADFCCLIDNVYSLLISNRPFLWQHTANDTWEDFEDHENVKIEKAYCSLKDTIDNVTLHPNKNVT